MRSTCVTLPGESWSTLEEPSSVTICPRGTVNCDPPAISALRADCWTVTVTLSKEERPESTSTTLTLKTYVVSVWRLYAGSLNTFGCFEDDVRMLLIAPFWYTVQKYLYELA